jgi:cytochrome c oxidase subunit 2
LWFRVDPGKEGIYRGQCAALCGRDHGFMPIVVEVRTPEEFKKWVETQKAAAKQAALPAPAAAPVPTAATAPAAAPIPAAVAGSAPPRTAQAQP